MIKQEIVHALQIIVERLGGHAPHAFSHDWCVIGSLSLYLHGIEIIPGDIDILTDKEGVFAINKQLREFEVDSVANSCCATASIQSYFATFTVAGIWVEVMGDMQVKSSCTNSEWVGFDNIFSSVVMVEFEGMQIPTLPLDVLQDMYCKFGRDKDQSKVEKIKEFLAR